MGTPEHRRLEKLFSAALDKDPATDRSLFLAEACGGDTDLREQIEGLLEAHNRVGSFLDTPPVDPDAKLESLETDEIAGTMIGRYKLLQKLGEGGFGTVYMAEQEEPVRRKVALKIIKLGMDTREVIARFEAEQQALALMDHPNIARVFDAGATGTGRPFFVMELVKGISITEYCDQNRLSTRDRLELILSVCNAVQHAHQKGIIHRDLNPNNVLVALHENRPVPKVIDFGIAKATSQRLTEKTLFTSLRHFLGTPAYMSPDQAEVSGLDMDTRTDIYTLGVMIYELLTGTTPFSARVLREASCEEIRRIIREVEPPKPSTRLQELVQMQAGIEYARLRRAEPKALVRMIRGDLDWIIMKAMEKDRTRRYATAKDLADDIERCLKHEPVLAGPPAMSYKLRKFVRRHRVGALAGAIVVAGLLAGLSVATVGLIEANSARKVLKIERNAAEKARASEERQRTLAEAKEAEAQKQVARSGIVSRFLEEMLRSVDPGKVRGREVTVRYILDTAVRKIEENALAGQPEVEAAVRLTLGETYCAIALYDSAETHLRTSAALSRNTLGAEHPETLQADRSLAGLLRIKGRFAEAEALLRETAGKQSRVLGEEHPQTLATNTELALALWGPGRYAEAESMHRRILAIQQRVFGEDYTDTAKSLGHLGVVCRVLGKTTEAEELLERSLLLCRRIHGEDHPGTAQAMNNLGRLLEDLGNFEAAEDFYRRTYELDCRILGPDHPGTSIPMNNLLRVLHIRNDREALRPIVADRLAILRRAAQRSGATATVLHAYAWELLNCEMPDLRDPETALPFAKEGVERNGARDVSMLETLARAYQKTGEFDLAVSTQRQAIALAEVEGLHDRDRLDSGLIEILLERGDLAGAVSASLKGLAGNVGRLLIPTVFPDAPLIAQSDALLKAGRYAEAAEILRDSLAMRRETLPEGHWLIADTASRLGTALAGEGLFAEAETFLLQAYKTLDENSFVSADLKKRALGRIIGLYETWDKPEEIGRWRRLL